MKVPLEKCSIHASSSYPEQARGCVKTQFYGLKAPKAHRRACQKSIIWVGVLLRLLHTPSFFVFFHSTFHPKHLTLNIQHLTLFKRTPFAFQNESFYHAKGVLLLFKTSPFASQKDSFCFMAKFILLSSIAFSVVLTRNCMLSFVKAPP